MDSRDSSTILPLAVKSESHPLWWVHTVPLAARHNQYPRPAWLPEKKQAFLDQLRKVSSSEYLPRTINAPHEPQPQPPPVSLLRRICDKCNPFDAPLHLFFIPFMILWAIIHLMYTISLIIRAFIEPNHKS